MNFVQSSYRPVMILVIESGAVYSATLISLLILYKQSSWFQYVLLDAVRTRIVCMIRFPHQTYPVDISHCCEYDHGLYLITADGS